MKVRPLHDRILIRRIEETENIEVKEGDHILFGKYSGTDIKIEGEEYLILREDEVLGILADAG